ncbi:MAG: hypothetical protein ABJB86_18355 [Bacteroidota bacterium]
MHNHPPAVSILLRCKKCSHCFTIYWHLDEIKECLQNEWDAFVDEETGEKKLEIFSYYETHPDGTFFPVLHSISGFDFTNYMQSVIAIVSDDEYWCASCERWQPVDYDGQVQPLKMERFLLEKRESKIYGASQQSFTDSNGLMVIHNPRLVYAGYYAN